jgi:uncharacterized protein DUF4158
LSAFGDEEPGESVRSGSQVTFDGAEFVTCDRLFDGQPLLETSDPEAGLIEVDVITAQAGRLADAQAVAVHHQYEQVIANAMPPSLGGLEQVGDFGFAQIILVSLMGIRGGTRATFDISPIGHRSRDHRNLAYFPWYARTSFNKIHLLSKVRLALCHLHRHGIFPVSAPEESHSSERWTLTPADHILIAAKSRANRLGFAVLLLFFREHGRFPADASEIDRQIVGEVAQQVHVSASEDLALNLSGRTAERHRAEIRSLFGYREATVADGEALEVWLRDQAAVVGAVPDHLVARLEARCRELAIEPPSADRIDRIIRAAIRAHEERLFTRIRDHLAPDTRARLEALLQPETGAEGGSDGNGQPVVAPALLLQLRADPSRPSLAGVQAELARLELVRGIKLPADLFDQVLPQEQERYRRRVAVEAPHELRRHPEAARLTLLAAFVHLRCARQSLVDLVS